jgi:hypothetical protein
MDGADTKKRKKPGRRKIGRITVTLRLFPTTKRLLAKIARLEKKQISDYAEELFMADFRVRGLIKDSGESLTHS